MGLWGDHLNVLKCITFFLTWVFKKIIGDILFEVPKIILDW